jgi:hypothetical protein
VEKAKGNLVHVENSGSMIAWAHATGLRGESCLNVFYREGLEATWVDADSAAAERVLFPFPSIPRFVFPGWETASNNGLSRLHGTPLRYLSTRLLASHHFRSCSETDGAMHASCLIRIPFPTHRHIAVRSSSLQSPTLP